MDISIALLITPLASVFPERQTDSRCTFRRASSAHAALAPRETVNQNFIDVIMLLCAMNIVRIGVSRARRSGTCASEDPPVEYAFPLGKEL